MRVLAVRLRRRRFKVFWLKAAMESLPLRKSGRIRARAGVADFEVVAGRRYAVGRGVPRGLEPELDRGTWDL